MPKQSLEAARASATVRQARAYSVNALFSGRAQVLAAIARQLHYRVDRRDPQSVTAIGYDTARPTIIFVARNAQLTYTNLERRLADAAAYAGHDMGDFLADEVFDWEVHPVNRDYPEVDSWHAEMLICRRVIPLSANGNLTSLTIGASTICCPDCSGWMTKYGIAHAPIGQTGATASKPWHNPRTEASFAYEGGQVSYYNHPDLMESLGRN